MFGRQTEVGLLGHDDLKMTPDVTKIVLNKIILDGWTVLVQQLRIYTKLTALHFV
jgi:hypothetical protein